MSDLNLGRIYGLMFGEYFLFLYKIVICVLDFMSLRVVFMFEFFLLMMIIFLLKYGWFFLK